MTPLDVADGIVNFLEEKLNNSKDETEMHDTIGVYSGFLPRVSTNEQKRKLCPAIVVHPYAIDDEDESSVGITVQVTTYDEDMFSGHITLYHLLEKVRATLLENNPVNMKYQIKNNKLSTVIPDDQPWPQWWGYCEFDVYIPKIKKNLNNVFNFD